LPGLPCPRFFKKLPPHVSLLRLPPPPSVFHALSSLFLLEFSLAVFYIPLTEPVSQVTLLFFFFRRNRLVHLFKFAPSALRSRLPFLLSFFVILPYVFDRHFPLSFLFPHVPSANAPSCGGVPPSFLFFLKVVDPFGRFSPIPQQAPSLGGRSACQSRAIFFDCTLAEAPPPFVCLVSRPHGFLDYRF